MSPLTPFSLTVVLTRVFSNDGQEQLNSNPHKAWRKYKELRQKLTAVDACAKNAHGAAPYFPLFVQKKVFGLRQTIRGAYTADLQKILNKVLWPKKAAAVPDSLQQDFQKAITRLLQLQLPELSEAQSRSNVRDDPTRSSEPAVLFPLDTMVEPIAARFEYHFSGNQATNRLDKPEYFLANFQEHISDHVDLINEHLQQCLFRAFRDTDVSLSTAYFDSTTAYIIALLPMLRRKIDSLVTPISPQPQLLSHLIHELLEFDSALRDEWHFDGGVAYDGSSTPWRGMTHSLLTSAKHPNLFNTWLNAEKSFALARYDSIISDPTAATLDLDPFPATSSLAPQPTNSIPTKSSHRLHDLLTHLTTIYAPLSSFTHKLRFLLDIQIPVLQRFHARLSDSLDAFISMTSGLGRSVGASANADDASTLKGTGGLDRLCRVHGSADFLERAMRDWNEELVFVELWTELQRRGRNPESPNLTGNVSQQHQETPSSRNGTTENTAVSDVLARTVTSGTAADMATSSDRDTDETDETGTIFTEPQTLYTALKARSLSVLIDNLSTTIRDSLRPYARLTAWNIPSSPSTTSTTPELTPALEVLASSLAFLRRVLSPLMLRRVSSGVCAKGIDGILFDRALMGHTFSVSGARVMKADVEALAGSVERYVGPAGSRGMGRVRAGMKLAAVDAVGGRGDVDVASDKDEEDAWSGDEKAEAEDGGDVDSGEEEREGRLGKTNLDLWAIEARLMQSNEAARKVLVELGMDRVMSVHEARGVVRCRVELQ